MAKLKTDNPKAIKALRVRLSMSPEEFGQLFGVEANTVYKWESGFRTPNSACLVIMEALVDPEQREWHLRRLGDMQKN